MTPEERADDELRAKHLSEWLGLTSALAFLGAFLVLVWQCVLWLKHGSWQPLTVGKALESSGLALQGTTSTTWQGLNAIMTWLLDLHVGFGIVAAGVVIGFALGHLAYLLAKVRAKSAA